MKPLTKSSKINVGYQHPKCYARGYEECSKKISKEHFISETILRKLALNSTIKFAGFSSQNPKTFDITGIKHKILAPNILCTYHNSALSPLDHVMGNFFDTIGNYDQTTHPASEERCDTARKVFVGKNIEKWMLKCLIGMVVSGKLHPTSHLKPECHSLLFDNKVLPNGWGLYLTTQNPIVYHSTSILIETKCDPTNGLILAADFHIRGIPFQLCMDTPSNPQILGIHRPNELIFESTTPKILGLTWDSPNGGGVKLSRVGSYDGAPPHWADWEKNG